MRKVWFPITVLLETLFCNRGWRPRYLSDQGA